MSTAADFDGTIVAEPAWPDVPQLSVPCIAVGGAGGSMNAQAVAIVARLNFLANGLSGTSTFLTGTGAPAAALGTDGSYYIDLATGLLYGPRAIGAWPTVGYPLRTFSNRYATRVNATWTAGTRGVVRIRVWGGGQGGYGNSSVGRGGAAAGFVEYVRSVQPGTVITCSPGAGGAGGAATGAGTPGAGGDSTVTWVGQSQVLIATGGGSGGLGNAGFGNYGNYSLQGEPSRYGSQIDGVLYPANGSSAPLSGGGGFSSPGLDGGAASSYGCGGGGAGVGRAGGAGAAGCVEILY